MRIAMIGATGLIGRSLAPRLLADGHRIEALQRSSFDLRHPRWHEHVAPVGDWPDLVRGLAPEAALSSLGTTMKKAGSQAGFREVDFDAVVGFAEAAREAGARRMIAVSSVGADALSRNFYLAIKGEMEAALGRLGFERLDIFRPGLLRGERGSDRRLGERIGILLSPLANLALRGRFDRYAAIDAETVATAIAATFRETSAGCFVHENRQIRRLAQGSGPPVER